MRIPEPPADRQRIIGRQVQVSGSFEGFGGSSPPALIRDILRIVPWLQTEDSVSLSVLGIALSFDLGEFLRDARGADQQYYPPYSMPEIFFSFDLKSFPQHYLTTD